MGRPLNILWLVLSQWRADQTGAGGHPRVCTPCFDAFAAQGVRIAGAVANHPFPVQSKATFLTGLGAGRSGVRGAGDALPAGVPTAAHWLREHGYASAHLGKWQLAGRRPDEPFLGQAAALREVPEMFRGGFDHWWGWESGFLVEDPIVHGTGEGGPRRVPGFQADVVAEAALALLERLPEPWFVCLHVDPPHPPWSREALAIAARGAGQFPLPGDVPAEAELERVVRAEFAASCADLARADAAFGRVLAGIARLGLEGRTVAAWFSNHGDQQGSQGVRRKGWPYAASLRVPCALRAPGVAAGRVAGEGLFGLVDLLPTSLSLAGVPVPGGLDGLDQSAALRSSAPLAAGQPVSLPEPPGIALQCPFAWQGRVGDGEISWVRSDGVAGRSAWGFPGWR